MSNNEIGTQENLSDIPIGFSTDPATNPQATTIPQNQQVAAETKISLAEQMVTTFLEKLPTEISLDQFIEKVVGSFLRDPKDYDDDFFFDIIKPAMRRLITLKDDMESRINTIAEEAKKGRDTIELLDFAKGALKAVSLILEDILGDYNIEPYKVEGIDFDPRRQTVTETIPTNEETQFGTVRESFSHGYERNGRIISKERVAAYKINN